MKPFRDKEGEDNILEINKLTDHWLAHDDH
jgi:hypothetical protein